MRGPIRLALAACLFAVQVPEAGADLWQWTDRYGVVRYTPNRDNVPSDRRGTLLRVEPGMKIPETLLQPLPASVLYAPPGEDPFASDPFDAPGRARQQGPGAAPPAPMTEAQREMMTRRAMLEARIARDEERLKELISEEVTAEGDPLIDSDELRDIARRLPALQAQLRSLNRRRARKTPN